MNKLNILKIRIEHYKTNTGDGGSIVSYTAAAVADIKYYGNKSLKLNIASGATVPNNGGACLAVRITLADGSYSRLYSDHVNGTTPTGMNNGWERVSLTFTIPEGATAVQTDLVLRNATGTAYYDGLQLEKGDSMNAYNLLENPSFENNTSGTAGNWTYNNLSSTDGLNTSSYWNGTQSVKIEGDAGLSKYVYQEVAVNGSEKDIYIASCWARANAVTAAEDLNRSFDIFVRVFYSDGSEVLKSQKGEFIFYQ